MWDIKEIIISLKEKKTLIFCVIVLIKSKTTIYFDIKIMLVQQL